MDKDDKKVTIERTAHGIKATLDRNVVPKQYDAEERLAEPTPPHLELVDNSTTETLRTLSAIVSRLQLANRAGFQFDGLRDLYAVFGWKRNLRSEDFLGKYVRQDITSRIIDAPPAATWSNPPELFVEDNAALTEKIQTEFDDLDHTLKIWELLYRADRLARLNHYSLILLGFDDTGDLSRSLSPDGVKELLWMRPVGSRSVDSIDFDDNVRSSRFGLPEAYEIRFSDHTSTSSAQSDVTTKSLKDLRVHHSRIIHVVENPLEDKVVGIPIIEKVYNLLDDLLKTEGGTAETYWLTANRGLHANVDKEMEINPEDAAALADEISEYQHQLRRVIRTRGVEIDSLGSDTPKPKEAFDMLMSLISGTTGIPKRILIGAEAGQLASEQDRANWAERIDERRNLMAEPYILEPLIDKLQETGLLSEGKVEFDWPTAFIQNPLEIGQTMAQRARAIGNISRQTGNKTPMQLTSVEEGRQIIGLEGELAEADVVEQTVEGPGEGDDSGDGSRGPAGEEDETQQTD